MVSKFEPTSINDVVESINQRRQRIGRHLRAGHFTEARFSGEAMVGELRMLSQMAAAGSGYPRNLPDATDATNPRGTK
jgi:hypothetical protein